MIRPAHRDEFHDYRGYAGQVAAGTVAPGDEVVVLPGGPPHHGRRASTPRTGRWTSPAPAAASRCCSPTTSTSPAATCSPPRTRPPRVTSEFETTLVLARREAAAPRRPAAAQARHPDHPGDRRGDHGAARPETLTFGEPGAAADQRDRARRSAHADPLPVDDYADVRATGSFLLIDPPTGNTLAAGLVGYPLRRTPSAERRRMSGSGVR